MKEHKKILVIKLGALGDFIQALGAMKAIRKHHPEAHITLLTTKPFEKFAKECGYFDDIWRDQKPKWFQAKAWLQLRKKLNTEKFDRVYDLQNNDRTGFYFKLMSPKPEWVGAAKGASHENNSPERTAGHAIKGHKQTLALAGINNVTVDTLEWVKSDHDKLGAPKPYVVFAAGSAPDRPEKRWPAEKYGTIAQKLANQGFTPVLLGTIAEARVNQIIKKMCPEALDLTARTSLADIIGLGREASATIGNDTGPMHMIGPTGCPSLVLFSGYSDPERHAPLGQAISVLQSHELENLEEDQVFQKLQGMLNQENSKTAAS